MHPYSLLQDEEKENPDKSLNGRDLGLFPGTLEKVSKVPTTVEVNAPGHGPAATVVEGGPWWPGPVTAEQ